jgi:hypothetical protein
VSDGQADDAARAASDAIDAWCAANPAPAWPVLPEGVQAGDFTAIWDGAMAHDPVSGVTLAYSSPPERVAVSYMSPTRFSDLTAEEQQALINAAEHLARAYGGRVSVEEALEALFRALSTGPAATENCTTKENRS